MDKFQGLSVDPTYMPSEYQKGLWSDCIIVEDGIDGAGNWHGWCPIHDEVRDVSKPTALFNFLAGVMVCNGDPSCHEGKRALSLTNVLTRMYQHEPS